MKTKFFFLLFLCMPVLAYSQSPVDITPATNVAGNAHYFVDASFGVSTDIGKNSVNGVSSDYPSFSYFNISPKVGYWLNDHIAVGAQVSFDYRIIKGMTSDPDTPDQEIKYKKLSPGWGFSIFGRYKLWGTGKFSLLAESPIGIGGGITKEKKALITKKNQSTSFFNISVYPLVSYDLTDKLSLIAKCEILSLNFSSGKSKYKYDNGTETTNTYSRFTFSAQSNVFLNIGIIYNF